MAKKYTYTGFKHLNVRLKKELLEEFQELLDKEGKSMAKVIRKFIQDYIKERKEGER